MILRQIQKLLTQSSNVGCRRYYSNRNIWKLKERGMFQDIFPDTTSGEVTDLCNAGPQTVYAGFDPTADSLHVGNLLVLINLLHWQRGGHNVIAVLGGATGRIGDPSGRSTERSELTSSFIDDNIAAIACDIERIFKNHETYFWQNNEKPLAPVTIVNNESWYNKISAVQIIGHVGRNFRMGTMLSRTSVQTRLASPAGMSFTEFSYQLFQAYDWLHLLKEYNCRFQVGGNDQMGNMMSGHELISKMSKRSVYGLTLPLVTTEIGDKFGKSAGNAVWLSSRKSSPFTLYQFLIRTTDADIERFLKLFTFDSVGSIGDLVRRHKEKPELRLAQKRLAEQVTLLVHGDDGLKSAQLASSALYEGNVDALGRIPSNDLVKLFTNATTVDLLPEVGMSVLDLAMKAKCFPTQNDALRIISAGGFYINNNRVKNVNEVLSPSSHFLPNGITLVRVGKKNYYIIKWFL
ncbi:Tyrosyl-tRNA synthetase mitochondrial [Carabus blaptoides fortunei]